MKVRILGYYWTDTDDLIVRTTERRLVGGERRRNWRGSGTVWHDTRTGERAPTWLEARLAGQWQLATWRRSDSVAKTRRIIEETGP